MELWGQVLTWPANVDRAIPVSGMTFLSPDVSAAARPTWLVITNLETIEAWESEWLGPLELHCLDPVQFKGQTTPVIKALTRGKPRPLWEVAARAGFWHLPHTALKWLAEARKLEVSDTTDLSLLEALVKSCCSDLSEDEVLECVSRRVPVPDEHDDFAKMFQIRRREVRTTVKKKRKREDESEVKKKAWPTGELSKQEAQSCLPLGWQCSSEPNQDRWQLWETKTRKTITRSWLAYGKPGAFKLAARAAWAYHVVKEGKGSDQCPWSDLLEQDETTGVRGPSSSH
eukprot:3733791-Amphidinium_carterae.2